MPAGRPTKLTPQKIKEALDYIDHGYEDRGDMIPSAAGMACALKIGKTTLYRWANEQPERFRHILEECNIKQERLLIANGLNGEFNSNITKLVLGKHGYHERKEVTGEDGGAIKSESKVIVTEMSPDEASEIYRSMLGSESQSED